jgi:hypothetical protein
MKMDEFASWLAAGKDTPAQTGEFIDADTLKKDGKRLRLAGVNAPEVGHLRDNSIFTPGQDVGETQAMYDLAKTGGFNEVVETGGKAPDGRPLVDLVDEHGSSLTAQAIRTGLIRPDQYTPPDVLKDRSMVKAVSLLFKNTPEEQKDEHLRIGEKMEQTRRDAGIRAFPRVEADNEAQRAALKGLVGEHAIQERVQEIARLEKIIRDGGDRFSPIFGALTPEKQAEMQAQIQKLQSEVLFAATTNDFVSGGVRDRHGDRNLNNIAHNQAWSTFWSGTLDILKGAAGMAEMTGNLNDWEGLSKWGRTYGNKIKGEQQDLPATITFENVSRELTDSELEWRDITDTGQYALNLVSGSLPMMAGLIGVGAATALTGGGALAVAAAPVLAGTLAYSGKIYTDQEDPKKNAMVALSGGLMSSVLDNLGLKGVMGASTLFRAADREIVKNAIIQKAAAQGVTLTAKQAEQQLAGETKREIMRLVGDSHAFAAAQVANKEARQAAVWSLMKASGAESSTEATQQMIEMLATSGEWNAEERYDKGFQQAIVEAAIGGGLAGGAFHGAGQVRDALTWRSLRDATDEKKLRASESQRFQADLLNSGQSTNILRQLDDANSAAAGNPNLQGMNLNLLKLPANEGSWSQVVQAVTHPLDFFRQLGTSITPTIVNKDGTFKKYRALLKSMMVPGVLPGETFDGLKQKVISEWGTPDRAVLATRLGLSEQAVDTKLREAWQTSWSKGVTSNDPILQAWWDATTTATKRMASLLGRMGVNIKDVLHATDASSVFTDATIDTNEITKNRSRLEAALVARGESPSDAKVAIEKLISGHPDEMNRARETLNRTGILADPQFNDLFHGRTLESFENLKSRVANRVGKMVYTGQHGEKLAQLLHLADQHGEFDSEADKLQVTRGVQDWYRIIEGNYHSLADKPALEKALAWASTGTMMAYLPKAALSSLAELSFALLGTPAGKMHKQLGKFAQGLVTEIRDDLNKAASHVTADMAMAWGRSTARGRDIELMDQLREELRNAVTVEEGEKISKKIVAMNEKIMGRSLFERLGYNDSGYNSQAKFETNTVKGQRVMGIFSRIILLRAQNDANRIALLSMAGDILRTHIMALQAIPRSDRVAMMTGTLPMTGFQNEALMLLQSYGADILPLLESFDNLNISTEAEYNNLLIQFGEGVETFKSPNGKANKFNVDLRDQLGTILTNMVNKQIAAPGTANMPKFYHDPRLRPFTVMMRFMATFTATVIPRLYRDYVRDGHLGMKFSAFSTMVTGLMVGHIANIMKDVLGYGDDENPYLKSNSKKVQRALYASGLMGTAQGLVDRALPLYPQEAPKEESLLDKGRRTLKGESPIFSWTDNIMSGMYGVSTADTPKEMQKGLQKTLRAAPLIGGFPVVSKEISDTLAGTGKK